jgi:hypothetical protein
MNEFAKFKMYFLPFFLGNAIDCHFYQIITKIIGMII